MKEKYRKINYIALILIMLILLAGGCMHAPQKGEPGGEGPAVVTIWHSLSGKEETAFKTELNKELEGHPEVVVKLKYVQEEDFVSQVYQAEAGGQGPHIFLTSRSVLYQLQKKGALAPAADTTSSAFPAAAAQFRFNSTVYAQPWLANVPVLYFRRDTVQAPNNFADLMAKGVAVASVDTQILAPLWLAQGGGVWDGKVPTLNKTENLTFLQQLATWKSQNRLQVNSNALALFTGGEVYYLFGPTGWGAVLAQQGSFWASIPLTDLVAPEQRVLLGETLGIANSAIKSQEAILPSIRLVEQLILGIDMENAMATAGKRLPLNPDFYGTDGGKAFPYMSQVLNNAWALEGDAPEWQLFALQNEAWNQVLNGAATADQALNDAQEKGQQALNGQKS